MRVLYLDCAMGVAGDMLMSALYELVEDKEAFLQTMKGLGIEGIQIIPKVASKCDIVGTHMHVVINGQEENENSHCCSHNDENSHHEHHHSDHHHDHCHHNDSHHHYDMETIFKIVDNLNVSSTVKSNIKEVYKVILRAESLVHGKEVEEIHLHEVGSLDAICDITGVCVLMDMLDVNKIVSSSVHVGSGFVKCAHGMLPVSTPATLNILKGVPIYSKEIIKGELATPTGVALLKHFAVEYGAMPDMAIEKIGYGLGTKDFPIANCLRAILGESHSEKSHKVVELAVNIDDMTAEEMGYAMDKFMKEGALDVYATPIFMKKWRNGTLLKVMVKESEVEKFVKLIFKHTTTIGIRKSVFDRFELCRSFAECDFQGESVNIKTAEGYGSNKSKIEFEDLKTIAEKMDISIFEARELVKKGL